LKGAKTDAFNMAARLAEVARALGSRSKILLLDEVMAR
jgi:ABC-type branched-subunit amino acid transport system ATPase component